MQMMGEDLILIWLMLSDPVSLSCGITACSSFRSVALWGLSKKKPLATVRKAHGLHGTQGLEQPYWISAVAALLNSDVVATGIPCFGRLTLLFLLL